MAPRPFRRADPFDRPDWIVEVKHDGVPRAGHITGHQCELRSRNGHVFQHWPQLVRNSPTR